jgi:DNA-directed RNA polymerase alpha subunit
MQNSDDGDRLPKIGLPATNALAAIGITQLSQVAAMTKAELLNLHGMGPKALNILETALASRGLTFKQEG